MTERSTLPGVSLRGLAMLWAMVLVWTVVLVVPAGADTTVVVTADDVGDTWFAADTRPGGTATFRNGPATPPGGTGSVELSTTVDPDKVQLLTATYDGVALADIDGIGYATYRDASSTGFVAGVAALNLRVDLDGGGTSDVYMVFEPYQDQGNAAVQTGVWQTWNAFRGGAAEWWINTNAGGCGQATPCTWDTILTLFPDATIREAATCGPGGVTSPCPGSLGINQGSFNPGIISSVDMLTVSVEGTATTYDFELVRDDDGDGIPDTAPPTSKDDCKKGGWAGFNNPTFRNQGQCVSWVNHNT
ncbi:hypothetical protein [Euzebya rosea]|uniref:hypothetical protein n=1 Tax=Euzebya rosea TaxID=2052804 RepID=UPI000D3E7ADE|nr:hypothetical protein [Euzebya rosea]